MPTARLWQAVALSLDREPIEVEEGDGWALDADIADAAQVYPAQFKQRLQIAVAHARALTLSGVSKHRPALDVRNAILDLGAFAAWTQSLPDPWNIPDLLRGHPGLGLLPAASDATAAPEVGGGEVGRDDKRIEWWESKYDILEMAQNKGEVRHRKRESTSALQLSKEIAQTIWAQERRTATKYANKEEPSSETIRKKYLIRWKFKPQD